MSPRLRLLPLALSAAAALAAVLASTPRTLHADPWAHDPTLNTLAVRTPASECIGNVYADGKGGAIFAVADPCTLVTSLPAHFPEFTLTLFRLDPGKGTDAAWPGQGAILPFTTNLGAWA